MNSKRTYKDSSGAVRPYPAIGQGPAEIATAADIARDELGFTNPNLHRRIEPTDAGKVYPSELAPRMYQLDVLKYNSYRTTEIFTHDEDSTEEEIP